MKKNYQYIILIIWAYLTIVLPSFFIIYALGNFSTPGTYLFDLATKTPNFQTLIGLFLALPSIGLYLSIQLKQLKLIVPWRLSLNEAVTNFFFSFLLAYVFWHFFGAFSFIKYFGGFILFSLFYFYLPQFSLFINSINFISFQVFLKTEYENKKINFEMLKKPITALLILIAINLAVVTVDKQIRNFNFHFDFLALYPKIQVVKPKIVYYGTKVILLGKNFGWRGMINTKFYNQYGNISIDLWTDSKIIFTIPLHWKLGDINVWVETTTTWDGKRVNLRSNDIQLKLIPVNKVWSKDDDAYFEQLKHLDKETLQINGY